MQELHSLCGAVLFQCMEAAGDRGASWLQLGFGKDILHAITSLPTHHGEMRVCSWHSCCMTVLAACLFLKPRRARGRCTLQ